MSFRLEFSKCLGSNIVALATTLNTSMFACCAHLLWFILRFCVEYVWNSGDYYI